MKSGIYIHIPFCMQKCSYCDFASWPGCGHEEMHRYTDMLVKEIGLRKDEWASHIFDTLFIGGGTPSLLPPELLKDILEAVYNNFNTELIESTIEANPGTVSPELLRCYRELGINRISFGMQAAQDELLAKIGRIHTARDCRKSVRFARSSGISNISFDLMSGLPGQNRDMLLESIGYAASLGASHISLYTLKLEEGTRLERDVARGSVILPDEDEEWAMACAARDKLDSLGYKRYEISNYAKEGFRCRHNIKYWQRAPYIGLGVAASSYDGNARTENTQDMNDYIHKINAEHMPYCNKQIISKSDAAFEALMLALRMTQGLDYTDFFNKFSIDLLNGFKDIITMYKNNGCLDIKNGRIVLTSAGMDIQNAILIDFMQSWPNQI